MAYASIALFFFLLPFFSHAYQSCPHRVNYSCPDFHGSSMMFPFTNKSLPDCGFCVLECINHSTEFQCGQQRLSYKTKDIFPRNNTLVLTYPGLHGLISNVCKAHQTDIVTLPTPPLITFTILNLVVLYRCHIEKGRTPTLGDHSTSCGYDVVYGPYASNETDEFPKGLSPADCSTIMLPNSTDDNFSIRYRVADECSQCASDRNRCIDKTTREFHCPKPGKKRLKIILSSVLAGCFFIILVILIIYWRKRKNKPGASPLASRIISFNRTTSDLEEGTTNGGVAVFYYKELEEATNNFDPTQEIGEGGFGIVYHGKLRDGREVAVKRLYEKNYKRIEQFKNEIEILTGLRHKNLVTLYGCTSRHSQELLLVYEYIPNGTVADHLHGDHPKSQFISWSARMNIAIETAEALSYLHYKDIIHRDVKTNNILLDNNFSVKVADFGLSRLFPIDVTHISTAPQGTPGYLDPEYHQCYHLTDRSDVYSFGVVLIELISSLPAVDLGRHRHEINLSNYAMIKIQASAFNELVDPKLGFETDTKVRRMTTLVAELAFQCLQHDRDLRPSMDEVLDSLKRIISLDYEKLEREEMEMRVENKESMKPLPSSTVDLGYVKNTQQQSSLPEPVAKKWLSKSMTRPPSLKGDAGLRLLRRLQGQQKSGSPTENDDVGLLRNDQRLPTSPASVMDNWPSQSSTPSASS